MLYLFQRLRAVCLGAWHPVRPPQLYEVIEKEPYASREMSVLPALVDHLEVLRHVLLRLLVINLLANISHQLAQALCSSS